MHIYSQRSLHCSDKLCDKDKLICHQIKLVVKVAASPTDPTNPTNPTNPTGTPRPTSSSITLNVTVSKKDSACVTLETGFDLATTKFELEKPATSSANGTWSVSSKGCLIYTSNGTPSLNADNICVIATNAKGIKDSRIIKSFSKEKVPDSTVSR